MPFSKKMFAITLAAVLASSAAGAEERCSGTLCDFYYGNSPPAAEQPAPNKQAAPTPLMVPNLFSGSKASGATAPDGTPAAPTGRVQVEGGGLLSLMRGQPTERCSGTLCDLYYGGPKPEKPEAAAAAETQAATEAASPDTAADEPDEAPSSRRRRGYETVERDEKPRCAATVQDPWRCYR